ncbi:hypothetical protein FSB84_00055 [Pseudobacter ginsenosidimutans]|uniref:ABC transporter ATP-binding protein n=1 Tax=Pseudobacter ginsenosidimutans TaxID=661488 RepID=UPI0011BBDAE1|nr:ABC transporter ATP-binding protein [Pseudobacter ginsenosidimutans]QEC40170.1 hypothetical protein FSB84_00055 [Pseudobacter ginsenosidimutans]
MISRYLSGDATEEERASLMKALQQDPNLMQQFDLLQQLWVADEPGNAMDVQNEKIKKILQLAAVEELLEQPATEMETVSPHQKKFRFRNG